MNEDKEKIIALQRIKIEVMSKLLSAQEQEISLLKYQLLEKNKCEKVSAL